MFNTCSWRIQLSKKIPNSTKTVRQHWVYYTFLDKGVGGVLDFRSENRQFAGIEEEENLESRQILAGQLRNNGTQGI